MSEKTETMLKDKMRRLDELKRLDQRLAKLSERKTNSMSAVAFCDKYGFRPEHICRLRKLYHVPSKATWTRIDSALKKEKV